MKKFRILSIALVFLITLMVMPAGAQAEEQKYPIFDALGINIDIDESAEITRLDLAKMVIDLAKLETITTGKATYVDVAETHWAFPVINTVTIYGYMGGLADRTFKPEAKASVADAAQVLMNLLGYGNFGKQANWSISDYLIKARSIGLLDGVSTSGGVLTVDALKQMVANMLGEKIVTVSSIGSDGVNYVVDDEITYIQSAYGYYFKEGTMQAAGKSAINGSNPVSTGKIKVGGTIYSAGGKDYSEFLGYEVRIIVDKDEENAEVLYVEKNKNFEDYELYMDASEIEGYANYTYSYMDETGSVEQAKISASSQIFLNGQQAAYDERIMKPLSGSVKLFDTDDNEIYDMVYITYEIFYEVSGVSEDEYVADAISGKQLEIEDVEFAVYENGISANISAIKNESIVAVMPGAITFDPGSTMPVADNTTLTKASIETVTTEVTGTVTGKGAKSCIVDGKEYSYSKYYEMLVSNGKAAMPGLNTYVVIYLNSEGDVVYSKIDTDAMIANRSDKYGYILRAFQPKEYNTKLFVKIFTEDAEFIAVETLEEIKINGSKAKATDLLSNTTLFPGGVFDPQLITFEKNEAGIVTAINVAVDYTYTTPYEGYDVVNFSKEYEGSIKYYNTFKHLYTIDDNTMMFEIPEDLNDEKKFKITTGKKVLSGNKTYYLEIYDTDEYYNIATIVVDYNKIAENGGSTEGRTLPYNHSTGEINSFVVYEKNIVLNNDGDERVALTGLTYTGTAATKMEVKTLIATEDTVEDIDNGTFGHIYSDYLYTDWSELEPGDVIHYRTDDEGYVDIFRLVFKAEDMRDLSGNIVYSSKGAHTSAVYLIAGAIHKVYADGNFLYRTAAEKTVANINKARPFTDQMSSVMIFIYENGNVRQGQASELKPEDSAFFISEYGRLYEVIVYR